MRKLGIIAVIISCAVIASLLANWSRGMVGNKLNSLVDGATQQFNTSVQKAITQEEARDAVEYYKTMEMNFIKIEVKHGIDAPLARFYSQTSNSLSILEAIFKVHPEYGTFEKLMTQLNE